MTRALFIFLAFIFFAFNLQAQSPGALPGAYVPKTAALPLFDDATPPNQSVTATVTIDYNTVIAPVSKYVYGNNANVYMSNMIDQTALMNNLKLLSPNIIRFPGGSISGTYFFNANKGQVPADAPAKLRNGSNNVVDAGYWFGKNGESWTMSVDHYYTMLQQTSSTGIITVNYDYARYSTADNPVASAAHLAADWVRYDKGRTKFWEIGNETYGNWQYGFNINTATNKDGQPATITGDLYGQHFKIFADSMRKAAKEISADIYIGAVLKEEAPQSWWNATEKNWNSGIITKAGNSPDYYIVHSYYTPYQQNSTPNDILNSAATVTKTMYDYVTKLVADGGLTAKPIALTEWNIFAEGSKQQSSFVNGIHATLILGELIKNKYAMAMRWDLANGWSNGNDHGIFNIGDEPGVTKWNPRAPFHYMYYFQKVFGDQMISSEVSGSADLVTYASKFTSGQVGLVLVNKGTSAQTASVTVNNFGYGARFYHYTLTGGSDNGDFSLKVNVNGQTTTQTSGGPNVTTVKAFGTSVAGGMRVHLPARSVVYALIENGSGVVTAAEEEGSFKVYPNPAKAEFVVEAPEGFNQLTLTDLSGRVVHRQDIRGTSTIRFPSVSPKGMYILKISGGGKVLYRKVSFE